MKQAYVYVHYRADDGLPFYVGKGRYRRYKRETNRSAYWQRVVKKHGLVSEIVSTHKTEREAFQAEIELIALWRETFPLVNHTAGGEGTSGYAQTKSHIQKRVASRLAAKHPFKPQLKQRGRLNHNYPGDIEATCLVTGNVQRYEGRHSLATAGFVPECVYKCCNGSRKTHKGHTFRRL